MTDDEILEAAEKIKARRLYTEKIDRILSGTRPIITDAADTRESIELDPTARGLIKAHLIDTYRP